MRSGTLTVLCVLLVVAGCSKRVWVKSGATEQEFAEDRYICLQQAQQKTSSSYANAYGRSASTMAYTDHMLFDACMNARGYRLQRPPPPGSQPQTPTREPANLLYQ
jgi:hypothetical protein